MKIFGFNFSRQKAMPVAQNGFTMVDGGYNPLSGKTLADIYQEGYEQNSIVRACVEQIARGAGIVKLELHKIMPNGDKQIITKHPLLELLERPNPTQSGAAFISELVTFHRVAGEAFVQRLPKNGKPVELWNLDPRYTEVVKATKGGVPVAYTYGTGESKERYPVNPTTGACQVRHLKTVNPKNPWRGLSPIISCAYAVDIYNSGSKWNARILENSGRPSGIVEFASTVGDNTLNQIKIYFKQAWQGPENAGNIPMLVGGAKFQPISHKPTDMDFKTSMTEAAKGIAMVYGVPLPLVTTEAATMANMTEAKEALWTDTIIPLLDEVLSALGDFLLPLYEADPSQYVLTFNPDSIPALEAKRTRLFERMAKAVSGGLLTPNEARLEMGFDQKQGADDLLAPTSLAPIGSASGDAGALVKAMKKAGCKAEDIAGVLETL